jgi:mRNA-degrading endonuclease RelE of RelBE toxin-antitoxin system
MNFAIVTTDDFNKEVKRLARKYRSMPNDLEALKSELMENPKIGDDLGDNTRKVRMAVASKNKGKRGGARVITYYFLADIENAKIYLLTIYDKGEQGSISEKTIERLKHKNGLL